MCWCDYSYFENGAYAKPEDFVSVAMMDTLIPSLQFARDYANRRTPSSDVWLGETSSCTNGGAPNLSNTYASGFL